MKHVLVLMLCCLGIAAKAAPTTTIANLNAVASSTPCQSATKVPLYGFDLAITGTGANPNLTALSFTTTGTYVAADVNKFQLWFNTTNNFATATQLSSNITTALGTGSHSFAAFSHAMTIGSTYYFWITTDATAAAGASRTIAISAIPTTSFTVSTGSTAGASAAGSASTFSTPTVAIAPAAVTRCSNGVGNTLTASGATSYTWSPAAGLSATTGATPVTTATATTTYTVTGTTSGCSSTASTLVTVNAAPSVTMSNAGPVCTSIITASGATTYTWAPATGLSATTGATLTPAPSATTTYTITGTNAAGCTNTATTTIYAVPTVSITSGNICGSGTIIASGAVTGGTVTYSWAPATGLAATTGASVSYTGGIYTTYTTTVTSNYGCTASTTSVAGLPTITTSPSYAASCVSGARTLTASGAVSYTWAPATYLSATTGASVTATPTVAGTTIYTVSGTDGRGCVSTTPDTSYAGPLAPMPWTEGFEGLAANTVQCNESFGPSLVTATGQEGTGTAAQVAAAAGGATGYGSTPINIPARTGSGLAGFGFHASSGSFFTPGFALTAGNTYQFSFWYRIDGEYTYTDDYNAYMVYNTTQSMTGATQFANFGTSVVPGANAALTRGNLIAMNNATYQQWTGYFTPSTTNNYYFGINGQNNNLTYTYYWTFDDVAFNQANNCVSPAAASALSCSPTLGSATNLTVTSAADSFVCVAIANGSGTPSAGPVNGTNYSIGASLGGGTIIAKGNCSGTTAAITGYLAPGTSYNFYVYTYQHDSCNGVAYSATYTTTSSAPSFTTCVNSAPTTPTIYSMLPGVAGTANIVLSDLPTTGTVVVHAYTNAAATIAATPASFSVPSGDSTITLTGASISTGSNLWFTVDQTIGGCTTTSSVSDEASVPCTLPWSQGFETGSSLNLMNPNYMQGNLGIYTDQTGATYGGEDNHGATYITPHTGTWEYLFFGGVTTTTSAPGTGAPYIPISVYANQWLVTPGLYCPTAGTYKLSFWYNNASGAFPSIKIQYSNIPNLPANSSNSMTSATAIATVTPTVGGGWHQYTTTVTLSAAQTIFIGFDAAPLSTSGYMAFDDMEFCQVPTIAVTNSSSTASVCASGSLSMTATPTPAASQTGGSWNYTWSGPGSVTSTSGAATATGLSTVGMNPTYSVSIINSADVYSVCASATATTIATITPVPTAITGSASICGGATSVYTGGATVGTPGWSITGAGASYATGTVLSGYSVTTTNPASQQSITINYSNACGTATPLTVNVNVQPVAITASDFISAPPVAICTLQSKTFTDNTTGGTWSNSPTAQGTINSSTGVFTSTSTLGTTIISYTMSTGGCFVTTSLPVGNSGPTAITGGAASVCVGSTTAAFASTPAGGTWSISPVANATISATATVTGVANTNGTPAVITYSTGCGTPQTKNITVNGTSGSITAPATICTGSTLSISSTGVTPTSGTTYAWSGPNTFSSTLANPSISSATIAANGTYTLTATNGACANTYSAVATVAPVPATPVLTSGASTICGGTTTTLAGTLANQTAQAFSIPAYTPSFAVTNTLNSATTWTSGTSNDGYYAASLPFNFSFYGSTYSTVYIGTNGYVTFGAGSTLAPATAITAGTPGNVIALFQNDLTLASSGTIQYGVSGTAPNRKFVVSYNAVPGITGGPNTGYIVLNESTNVIDVVAKAFTRNTGANATCGIASAAGAGGVAATGRNNAAYNVTTPEAWRFYSLNNYNYAWTPAASVATSNTAATTTSALSSTTVYTLTVSDNISSSCTSSATSTINITGTAAATLSNTQECIGASSVNMAYASATNTPTTYDITWNSAALTANFSNVSAATFPGGTSGNIPVSIGNLAAAGSTYHGTLTLTNAAGCPSSYSFTTAVKTQPSLSVASITVNPNSSTMCVGQAVTLNVSGASGSATPYVFTWRGPNISGSPTTTGTIYSYTTTGAATGAYSVSLSSSSTGCIATPYLATSSSYTLLSSPVPTVTGLTATPGTVCTGNSVLFTTGSSSGGTQYNWSGPAGYSTTSATGSVTMTPTATAAAGTYAVTLTNTVTSCTSNAGTASTILAVNLSANPGTITASATTMCAGSSVTLTDTTSGGTWSSSNPAVATVSGGVVTGVAAGTATISFGVSNSCGTQYATKVVTVTPMITASAISGSATICTGSTVTLTDTASGGTWASSNTSIATVDAVTGVVTPVAAGSVTISYTTSCASLATKAETVVTSPAAITGTSTICSGSTSTLSNTVGGGTWSSANTSIATISGAGVMTGVTGGTTTITYNNSGCVATTSATIQALPSAISGATAVCLGSTSTMTNTVSGGTWVSSNTAAGTINAATGVLTAVAVGTTNISYTTGCGSATPVTVTVQQAPAALAGLSSVCAGNTITLTESVPSGSWSSSNSSLATVSGGVVTGVAAGSVTISYTLTNSCGTQYATKVITVNPASIASAISGSATICTGSTVTLTDTAAGGSWTSSNTGIATVNSSTGVVTPVAAGSVTISYTTSCASLATKAETVVTSPAAITGTSTICSGTTSTLANTVGGGTWSSNNTSVATISGTGLMTGVAAGSATITYNNSGCVTTTTANVIASPSSITGTTTFCQGSTTALSNTANGGTWSSSNTGVAAVDAATGVVTGVATGSATISYSTGCGSIPTVAVTIQHAATAITGGSSICAGTSVTLSESIPSGTWSSSNTSVATVDASGVVTGIASGVDTISYTLINSCGTSIVTQAIPVNLEGKWLGVNNNWNDASNWPCGVTPSATLNVEIPAGTAYLPNFAGLTVTVKNLTIDSSVAITVNSGATINVKGDLIVKGAINGNGLISMNGSSAQTIYGKGTLYNVTLNNVAGVTINSGDSIKIKGDLTLSAGSLTSNGGLVLAVDSVSQGRLAPAAVGSFITGNVNVQQYIPGGRRAFRFFGHPFNGPIALSQIQRTVDVTGNGGTANGFTSTITNAPSVYWYHTTSGNATMGYDPGWVAFANANSTTDTNSFKQYEGIRLFVRGSKNEGLDGLSYTPDAAVISMAGTLNIGAQTVTLRKGAHSGYNQVSNPYPSPTDIGSVINAAKLAGHVTGAAFFVWNPYLGTNGAFEAKPIGGSYVIGMNTSFQVQAAFDSATLSFAEANKVSAADEALLRNSSTNQFLSMQVVDANDHAWDNMYFSFNANATDNDDKMLDAGKPLNPDLNFYSLSADNKKLSIDARPFTDGSVIPLGFTTNYAQEYTIKVTNMVAPENGNVYLHDKLNDVYTMLAQGAEYKFEVTADAKTQGEKRFELTTEGKVANQAEIAKFNMTLAPNPATDVVTVTFTAPAQANTTVRILDISGVNVVTKELGAQQNGKIAISINELPAGMYMVEFTSGDYKKVSKLIKE